MGTPVPRPAAGVGVGAAGPWLLPSTCDISVGVALAAAGTRRPPP